MAVTEWDLMKAYEKGCRDQKQNNYSPPYNAIRLATGFGNEDERLTNASYDRGWEDSKRGLC